MENTMTEDQAVRKLAEEYRQTFTVKQRDNGQWFTTLKDYPAASGDVQELIARVHDDRQMAPDDYRYVWTVDALDLIRTAEEDQDLGEMAYEIEADIYTADLMRWLGSHAWRYEYANEALREFGGDYFADKGGIIDMIQFGQAEEKREVYQTVLNFLREHAE